MNRKIKFRVWDGVDYMSSPFTLNDLQLKVIQFASNCVVMQFTGLKDKNGIEIYEGDWVKYWNLNTDPIVYHNNGFYIHYDKNDYFSMQYENKNCEVVGNIYQNPELKTPKK